jgi:anaerobic magnesium-protoporphyrin IX monomethyl ester cyclase
MVYPIMTSRGCPNQCSFCASFGLSRKWRPRKPEECIEELELAKKNLPPFKVIIFDDNPTVDKKRFYRFLELYHKKIKRELFIVNTRADGIDDTFLTLLKKCGVDWIAIGVEHAHPEVYKLINKGESLQQIENACKLIKKHKLELCLSFVVGLPGDNLERTKESIKFYKKMKADQVSLNHITPFRHTAARKWFEEHNSKIYNEIDFSATPMLSFECEKPVVDTPDFSIWEREKAFYLFILKIADQRLQLRKMSKIFRIAKKYNLYREFIFWLPNGILTSLKQNKKYLKKGFLICRREGFVYLLKRYLDLMKKKNIYKNYSVDSMQTT